MLVDEETVVSVDEDDVVAVLALLVVVTVGRTASGVYPLMINLLATLPSKDVFSQQVFRAKLQVVQVGCAPHLLQQSNAYVLGTLVAFG